MCVHACVHCVQSKELKLQGNSLFKQGKLEEAARCYEEAIQVSTESGDQRSLIGNCHQNLAAVYDEMVRNLTCRSYVEVCVFRMCCNTCTYVYMYAWMKIPYGLKLKNVQSCTVHIHDIHVYIYNVMCNHR